MDKKPQLAFIPLFIAAAAACGLLTVCFAEKWVAHVLLAVCVVSFSIGMIAMAAYKRAVKYAMNDIFRENDTTAGNIITNIAIPCVLFDSDGKIAWCNDAFSELYPGTDICRLIPDMDPRFPNNAQSIEYNGQHFQLMSMPVQRIRTETRLTFQYWLDRTEALHYSRLYEEQMPTVGLIQVDNYDDLMTDRQFHRNSVLSEVERRVSDFVTAMEGVYRRYDNSKFFFVFEAKRIAELEQQRFTLLDEVREIDTGTGQPVTLSISIGVRRSGGGQAGGKLRLLRRQAPGNHKELQSKGAAFRRGAASADGHRGCGFHNGPQSAGYGLRRGGPWHNALRQEHKLPGVLRAG